MVTRTPKYSRQLIFSRGIHILPDHEKRNSLFFQFLRYASFFQCQAYTVDALLVSLTAPKISAENVQNSWRKREIYFFHTKIYGITRVSIDMRAVLSFFFCLVGQNTSNGSSAYKNLSHFINFGMKEIDLLFSTRILGIHG